MLEFLAGAGVYALVDSFLNTRYSERPSIPPGVIPYRGRYIRIPQRTEFAPCPAEMIVESEENLRSPSELLAAIEQARHESAILKGCG